MLPRIPLHHLHGPPEPDKPLRLMERVRRKLRELRYSRRTEEAYVHWIRRYVVYHGRRHPNEMAEEEIRECLSALAVEEGVAAATQNQALIIGEDGRSVAPCLFELRNVAHVWPCENSGSTHSRLPHLFGLSRQDDRDAAPANARCFLAVSPRWHRAGAPITMPSISLKS